MDLLGSALHPLSALAPLLRRVGRWLEAGFAACFCHPLLALPLYLCTFPVAEIYFYSLGRRFSRRHQRKPHSVYSAADAREAARYWGTLCDTLVAERSVDESLSEDSGGWFGGAEGSPGRDRRRSRESRSSFEQREGVEAMLRGWFIGDSALSPRRDNVEDFLSWAIFNEDSASLDPSARAEVASLLLRCEEAMGRPLPPGREEGLVSMSYTLEQRWAQDAARQVHRLPLLVYLMLQLGDQALGLFLRGLGYRRLCSGRLEYWCRPALVPSPSLADDPRPPPPPPMVFLHGVLGLLPYPILLAQLCAHHTGAVLVPVFPHCSLRLDHLCAVLQERTAPHDASELASAVHRMLARHSPAGQHPRGTFLCHSLGSAHLASLLKRVPELVAGCAFVDPICFLMPDGHVLRNFLYGRREGADWSHGSLSPISWFHYAQTRFVCCEPTVQDYFRRCFWWGQCWLHPSEIGCDAIVLLSGHDTVADAHKVYAHLRAWQTRRSRGQPHLELELHHEWSHGWLLLRPGVQRRLIWQLARTARDGADDGAGAQGAFRSPSGVRRPSPLDEAKARDEADQGYDHVESEADTSSCATSSAWSVASRSNRVSAEA